MPGSRFRPFISAFANAAAAALLLAGCAGGMPLLHPAQVLKPGELRAVAGGAAHVAVGGAASAVNAAVNEATQAGTGPAPADATYARGALVAAAIAPGISPLLGLRIGLPNDFEGGLVFTGRSIRADMRHAFNFSPSVALSVGVGGTALMYGQSDGTILPNVDVSDVHGYGADVPVLIGYASDAGLIHAWAGVRASYEHILISQILSEPTDTPLFPGPTALSADHASAGGLVGFAIGFKHIHVAVELDAAYENVRGTFNSVNAQVSGVSVTPGGAAWWTF